MMYGCMVWYCNSKAGAAELPKVQYTKNQQESLILIAKTMGIITAVSIIAVLFIPLTYTKSGIAWGGSDALGYPV